MKRKIFLLGAVGLFSSLALGFSGTVELGYENEAFTPGENQKYSRGDFIAPYIGLNVNPFPENKLRVEAKYMYQHEYNLKKNELEKDKFRKERDRIEFYLSGYQYRNGDFRFSPKAGIRYEHWKTNPDNIDIKNLLNNQNKDMVSYRFYPNMTYQISKEFQFYLSGFTGPTTYTAVGKDRSTGKVDANDVKERKFTNNWSTEMEIVGLKYTIPGTKNMIGTSFYYESKYIAYDYKYDRYQARVFGTYNVNNKFAVNPFIRLDLDYDQKNLRVNKENGMLRDRKAVRIGMSAAYKVNPTLTLGGEIYWLSEPQHTWSNTDVEDRAKFFNKLYIRKAF